MALCILLTETRQGGPAGRRRLSHIRDWASAPISNILASMVVCQALTNAASGRSAIAGANEQREPGCRARHLPRHTGMQHDDAGREQGDSHDAAQIVSGNALRQPRSKPCCQGLCWRD